MRSPLIRCLLVLSALPACTQFEPDFTVRPGVETATVLDGVPGAPYTLYDADDNALLTLFADDLGQAHFAYIPSEYAEVQTGGGTVLPFEDGDVVRPGEGYEIRDDDADPVARSGEFRVLAVDDLEYQVPVERQVLKGIEFSPIDGARGDLDVGFQYLQMRDGVLLSVMVRFPDFNLYGHGPWPTVIEYSGYSPSRPDRSDRGSQIANAMGYATVSVNMRGTGCSGGVYDVFNRAQHADGYDVVEAVASQTWVLNNQVGMVGLSYPGISQLYVASTRPPSLAAIVPMSVIADPWQMQWPGGVYNKGFTRQWVEEREAQAGVQGSTWVTELIDAGDTVCADNVALSSQNIDFESFLHGLKNRPAHTDDRDLNLLVGQIETPVFLGGQFQDEQTGAQFGGMLDRFDNSRATRFMLSNGRHPDGFAPSGVFRWFEFLEFYVSERIPEVNSVIRLVGAQEIGNAFHIEGYKFPEDRFTQYASYSEALAAYEAEPDVLMLIENGAGNPDQLGVHFERSQAHFDTWPPADTSRQSWYLDADGQMSDAAVPTAGADLWTFDPKAGDEDFFGPSGYQIMRPIWDQDWTRFAPGDAVSYVSAPFSQDTMVAGPGIAELWIRSPEDDVTVQVTLTEVRPDGNEVLIQSGWLRVGHRAASMGDDMRLKRSFSSEDYSPVPVDEWVMAEVSIPSVAHPVRAGSQLRMIVSTPGRDHGTWLFEAPDYDGLPSFELGRGGEHGSKLTMAIIPGVDIAEGLPPCPSLRGQPCRAYEPVDNVVAE